MINLKTILKNNKKNLKYLFLLLFLGFLICFILIKKTDPTNIIEEIKNIDIYLKTNHINFIPSHFIYVIILCFSSFIILGPILIIIYMLYEAVCISFNIYTLTLCYKINGFIYSLFYNIITKFIFIFLIFKIFKISLKICKSITKKDEEAKASIIKNSKKLALYFCLIILNDVIIYLIGNTILSKLLFIIK